MIISLLQITPNQVGLPQLLLQMNETEFPDAYRQFMKDIAMELGNDTSMTDTDVESVFNLDKEISQVNPLRYIVLYIFISRIFFSIMEPQMENLSEPSNIEQWTVFRDPSILV
jgi:hypothetical protein